MTFSIRPVRTFVLRLWREPGDQEGDARWRGLIRSLENLPQALHALLATECPSPMAEGPHADPDAPP
jgi:hypothetical protein